MKAKHDSITMLDVFVSRVPLLRAMGALGAVWV
jgi:hypothetical protein